VYSDKDKDIESSIDSDKQNDKPESSSHHNRSSPHPFFF